jgi:maleate isomerase
LNAGLGSSAPCASRPSLSDTHRAAFSALSNTIGTDAAITTNGLDSLAALRASGIHQPFLVMPPWFGNETLDAGVRYYADHGFAPAAHLRYDPGPKWRDVPTNEMYPRGLGFEQEIEPLYAQIIAACPPEADGVLIAGTGFRCVAILDALEKALKRPVLSANLVSLWHCLRLAGVQAKISGYGSLFQM